MHSVVRASLLCLATGLAVAGCATAQKAGEGATSTNLGPAATKWSAVKPPQDFIDFFAGTFHRLGITVVDSGEQFTIINDEGKAFRFEPGHHNVDFVVPVTSQNIDNLVRRTEDGKLDDEDAYAIESVMFTPITRALLQNPATKDESLRQVSGVEDTIYVVLVAPDGSSGPSHTLAYRDRHWEVVPGEHGTPKRTFRIDAKQARDFQVRAFNASRSQDLATLMSFATWYKDWRDKVSVAQN
jgi:hypothetical protein